MKHCLKCDKEFQEKKETAKFCSTSCRVMYNRKREKKVEKIQDKVMYNQILEAMDDFRNLIKSANITHSLSPTVFDAPKSSSLKFDEMGQWKEPKKLKIRRSFENYQELKLECDSLEAWHELKAEILASELSPKQKQLLTT